MPDNSLTQWQRKTIDTAIKNARGTLIVAKNYKESGDYNGYCMHLIFAASHIREAERILKLFLTAKHRRLGEPIDELEMT